MKDLVKEDIELWIRNFISLISFCKKIKWVLNLYWCNKIAVYAFNGIYLVLLSRLLPLIPNSLISLMTSSYALSMSQLLI